MPGQLPTCAGCGSESSQEKQLFSRWGNPTQKSVIVPEVGGILKPLEVLSGQNLHVTAELFDNISVSAFLGSTDTPSAGAAHFLPWWPVLTCDSSHFVSFLCGASEGVISTVLKVHSQGAYEAHREFRMEGRALGFVSGCGGIVHVGV